MTPLAARLAGRMREAGPIPLAEFMAAALGDPDHGYYATRDPLGRGGDFITAPEVSQMMGEMIAAWCVFLFEAMGAPSRLALVELGPGRGTLMADLLRTARIRPRFLRSLDVRLVETSPVLRRAQEAALSGHAARWHRDFAEATEACGSCPAIVIANEFFDALPIHQLVRTPSGWRERLVEPAPEAGAGFRFVTARLETPLARLVPAELLDAPEGSVFEIGVEARALAHAIAAQIVSRGGAALIVDYGHLRSGLGETLQAVRGHAFSDPLADPGEADVTAHVDFAALAESARAAGAYDYGPVTQRAFLAGLGIEQRTATLRAANPARANEIDAGLKRLIGGDAMGTLFKVLALADPGLPAPPGFARGDIG